MNPPIDPIEIYSCPGLRGRHGGAQLVAFPAQLGRPPLDIRHNVEAWLRMLRDGGPRSRPRHPRTAWTFPNAAQPVLVGWSTRYQHLREVTCDPVLAVFG